MSNREWCYVCGNLHVPVRQSLDNSEISGSIIHMNRTEVIEAAKQYYVKHYRGKGFDFAEFAADFHLAQNPWIPVEDGLPEVEGWYQVTLNRSAGMFQAALDYFNEVWVNWGSGVIAWKRLDEPYQSARRDRREGGTNKMNVCECGHAEYYHGGVYLDGTQFLRCDYGSCECPEYRPQPSAPPTPEGMENLQKAVSAMTKVCRSIGVEFRDNGTPITIPYEVVHAKEIEAENARLRAEVEQMKAMLAEADVIESSEWEIEREPVTGQCRIWLNGEVYMDGYRSFTEAFAALKAGGGEE